MIDTTSVRTVAGVGSGVIGASCAAYYPAKGLDVIATDPVRGAEERCCIKLNSRT